MGNKQEIAVLIHKSCHYFIEILKNPFFINHHMVMLAEKEYVTPLVEISEDERDENAQRLLNCYSNGIKIGGGLRGLLKSYISKFVRNEHDQEDILGEYNLQMVNKNARLYKYSISESEDLAKNRNFLAWAKKSIARVSIDFLRRKSRRGECFFSEALNNNNISIENIFPDECIDSLEEAIKNEHLQGVRDSLEQLGAVKRDILNLYYFNNLEYEEIAKELKIPVGTVKSRLHQSKKEFLGLEDIQSIVN
jgi:RNA polymerase sigma factor (sigma-70 family)